MRIKHYFLDTDVIFNFSMILVRAEINVENFNIKYRKIITTININENQLELYIKTWKNIKKTFIFLITIKLMQ